jgi:hypothetical protein
MVSARPAFAFETVSGRRSRWGALLDARIIFAHEADVCLYWLMLGYHGGKANPIMQEKV